MTDQHPLERFAFCPSCGSDQFHVNNEKSKRCARCGFVYYANPSSATAAFIVDEHGRLLVARRGKAPAKGTLDLPGGFCDMYESTEQGMAREIREETGLDVGDMRYLFSVPNLYEYSGMTIHTLDMFFEIHVEGAHPSAADDAASLQWMDRDDIDPDMFGLDSVRKAVKTWLDKESV